MPKQVVGSDLEVAVYNWLVKHSYRPDIDFQFQSHLIGGYGRQLGDVIADFVLTNSNTVLRIQGEYWHRTITETARDRIQKERLQGLGYVVVDLWQRDLTERLNYTMEQAVQGVEMPHYATYRGLRFPSSTVVQSRGGGIIPIPGRVSGPNTIQGDLIDVLTENPTGLVDGQATLNGELKHDGGVNCQCQFKYEAADIENSLLCYIFPWRFHSLIQLLTPNVSLDFACTPVIHNNSTPWQSDKRAGDEFSAAITGLVAGLFYSYKAGAKNVVTADEGESIIFSQ